MKKLVAITFSLLLALSVLVISPAKVYATDASSPMGRSTVVYGNGTELTITSTAPASATEVTTSDTNFTTFTATGTSAYISWVESGTTKYIGVSADVSVYGGGIYDADYATTKITMNSGTIKEIYGGGDSADKTKRAKVTTATIIVNGGSVTNAIYGGGVGFADVGTANITINTNGTIGNVVGGGGSAAKNMPPLTYANDVETTSVVDKSIINIVKGTVKVVVGGGQGLSYVKDVTINITGGTIGELVAGGMNGKTLKSTINMSAGEVTGHTHSANRGEIEDATFNITGGELSGDVYLGNDLSGDTGAVTKSVTFNAASGVITGKVFLGSGLSGADKGDTSGSTDNVDTISVDIHGDIASSKSSTSLNNALSADTTLNIAADTTLYIPSGAALDNKGTINNSGTVDTSDSVTGSMSGDGKVVTSGIITVKSGDAFVTLDPNGSSIDKPVVPEEESAITLPKPADLKGYTFAGWKSGSKIYKDGETVSLDEGIMTFTAQWTKVVNTADSSNPLAWTMIAVITLIGAAGFIFKKHFSNN